jgi:hypothetical protein
MDEGLLGQVVHSHTAKTSSSFYRVQLMSTVDVYSDVYSDEYSDEFSDEFSGEYNAEYTKSFFVEPPPGHVRLFLDWVEWIDDWMKGY